MAYDHSCEVVVLFGGRTTSSVLRNETWEWNGATWTEFEGAPGLTPRMHPVLVFDRQRENVVLFGGNAGDILGDTWVRTGTIWTRLSPSSSPSTRQASAAVFHMAAGVTIVHAGCCGGLSDTWTWNGTDWAPLSPEGTPGERYNHAMAYDAERGVAVMFGGNTDEGEIVGDTWELRCTEWE